MQRYKFIIDTNIIYNEEFNAKIFKNKLLEKLYNLKQGYEEFFDAVEDLGYVSSWGVTGTFFHTLHRFWSIEVTGSYRERDYEFIPRKDKFWTAGGTIAFEPVDWFRGELRYEHTAFDTMATLEANDYVSNRVMLILQFMY